mmetsp:Transcript_1000/g.3892  ORF Transcript_1000/g.3892 Transcript_1000/m.3892 type:complete len:291 (-) Transcript_1000:112-984(-)
MSRLKSMNPSNLSDALPHVAQVMRDRSVPPNVRHTKLVSLRKLPSLTFGGAAASHCRLCIASSTHRANSCASSCRPLRKVFETDLKFFTRDTGAIARGPLPLPSPPPSARQMCSPISYTASNPPRRESLRCSPARQNDASGGVCVRHCVTAFRKQVLPRLARPAPTRRTEGQRVLKCTEARGYRGFETSSIDAPSRFSSSASGSSFRRRAFVSPPELPFASSRASFDASRTIMRLCASSETRGGSARLARTNESLRRGGSTSRSRGANGDGLARLPMGADGRLSASRFGR